MGPACAIIGTTPTNLAICCRVSVPTSGISAKLVAWKIASILFADWIGAGAFCCNNGLTSQSFAASSRVSDAIVRNTSRRTTLVVNAPCCFCACRMFTT